MIIMAMNITSANVNASIIKHSLIGVGPKILIQRNSTRLLLLLRSQAEGRQGGRISEENKEELSTCNDVDSGLFQSARSQLDLLQQLTSSSPAAGYETDSSSGEKGSIREQLSRLAGDRDDDFSIPLGKNLKKVSPKFLTTSQKRNIRRQTYLNQVSQRNDSVFFATIGAFVLLPPLVILGIAIITGYVQLFP